MPIRYTPVVARSLTPGCLVTLTAGSMFLFLIGYAAWLPFRQARIMESFTQPAPVALPATQAAAGAEENLEARVEKFRTDLAEEKTEARLSLDRDDLNLAIATYPALKDLRGTLAVHVTAIHDRGITADTCFQLNGRPRLARDGETGFLTSDPRYLVGKIVLSPVLSHGELDFAVRSITVDGAAVPSGFLENFAGMHPFKPPVGDPLWTPYTEKLTRAALAEGQLILERIPGALPPGSVSDSQFHSARNRFAGLIGGALLCILMIAAGVFLRNYRARLKKALAEDQANQNGGDA